MKTFNIIILIIVSSTIVLYGQNNNVSSNNYLNSRVYGYVVYDGQDYLATEQGFLPVDTNQNINDKWRDYYRKIYGDSTLSNPNTIIGEQNSQFPVQFFISLDINKLTGKKYSFTDQLYLYDFIQAGSKGGYSYQPGIIGIIGGLEKRNGLKLPKVK